jgi:hypothetical protein
LDVTDSLPMPRRTGLLVAIENMTSAALSVIERPLQSPKPNTAEVLSAYCLQQQRSRRMRIRRLNTIDPMEGHPLPSGRVALVEFDAIRDLFDGITVEIDLEFVHPFRMKTGTGHGAGDRMANIDHE